jgi:hypothetical protein
MPITMDHREIECKEWTEFIYLPPTERSSPITGNLHNAIQNTHAVRKQKNKKELQTSQYNTYKIM